jgi:hypothetical protein
MGVVWLSDYNVPDRVKCSATQRTFKGTMESILMYPEYYKKREFLV